MNKSLLDTDILSEVSEGINPIRVHKGNRARDYDLITQSERLNEWQHDLFIQYKCSIFIVIVMANLFGTPISHSLGSTDLVASV